MEDEAAERIYFIDSDEIKSSADEFNMIKPDSDEERIKKKISKVVISQIKMKPPISIHHLFPSRLFWQIRDVLISTCYFILIVGGSLAIILSIIGHIYLYMDRLNSGNLTAETDALEAGSVILFCATIVPLIRGSIQEFVSVPYANLPNERFHFYKPRPLLSFVDCYYSFWYNVEPAFRKFRDSRLTFYSSNYSKPCKQISENRSRIVGVDSCLTVDIKCPVPPSRWKWFSRESTNVSRLPIVVLLSGRTYMENRPFQVADSVVHRAQSIFITINFRLGVLGFSNFDSMRSPRNLGVRDFLNAMEFIASHADSFNGNRNNMTLLSEDSGATTAILYMLMKKARNWFSKIWLIDGSVFVPDPPVRNPFYELYSTGEILCSNFNTEDDVFDCLQNFTTDALLRNSPSSWLTADRYFERLPNLFETRDSIVEKQDQIILSPLESVMRTGSDIPDIPIVIMSKIDYTPNSRTGSRTLTKSQFYTRTRLGLLTYQTVVAGVVMYKEIDKAYTEYIKFVENRSIFYHNTNKDMIPLGFEDVLHAVIADLRVVCPYTAVAKYLQTNAHIATGPIYRLFDGAYRYTGSPMHNSLRCDLSFFLQDQHSACKSHSQHIPDEYRESLLSSFITFIRRGTIDNVLPMEYPHNSTMRDFEDTFSFIGRLGYRTPGVRETAMLQACNLWRKGADELPMLKTSAKVN